MKSKTIIVSSPEENNTRGILTLFQEDDLLKCRLRVYNMDKLSKHCKLGIYHQNEVMSSNLIERNRVYESSFVGNFDIDQDFYVALIDTGNNNQVLLAGGTYQGFYFNDNSVFLDSENFSHKQTNLTQNFQENIEDKCEENCDKCENCVYKKAFYLKENSNNFTCEKSIKNDSMGDNCEQELVSFTDENIERNEDLAKQEIENFVTSIIPQLEDLLRIYPEDKNLNSLIENGKFVQINDNGEGFSIGVIYKENKIQYICYAIKRDCNINPPKELGKNYQWLPLDAEDTLSEGYYVVFQDVTDLKIVEI